jgi:hypothetical protein
MKYRLRTVKTGGTLGGLKQNQIMNIIIFLMWAIKGVALKLFGEDEGGSLKNDKVYWGDLVSQYLVIFLQLTPTYN